MSKDTFLDKCNQVKPLISKQDTKYRKAILIEIQISCVIYKLTQGANILTCSELFTIGRSIVSLVFCEVVMAINVVFKKLITWPMGDKMQSIMMGFKNLCGMPNVMGAIDGIHICIAKPIGVFLEDYYYHTTEGYTIVAQAMVDNQKRFLDTYVGLLGNVNDLHVLKKYGLY